MSGKVILPGEGKSVRLDGIGVVFKLDGADTGDSFALVEHAIEPGTLGAPSHRHHHEDVYSYILAGEVTVLVGERVIEAGPGTLIAKPRGVMHAFWNAGSQPARVLEIIAPAGFEQYFLGLGEMKCTKMRGKRGENTVIPTTRPEAMPTRSEAWHVEQ